MAMKVMMPTWLAIEPAQMGLCAICVESRVCRVCDAEFGRPICEECLEGLMRADVVLRLMGFARPVPRSWNNHGGAETRG